MDRADKLSGQRALMFVRPQQPNIMGTQATFQTTLPRHTDQKAFPGHALSVVPPTPPSTHPASQPYPTIRFVAPKIGKATKPHSNRSDSQHSSDADETTRSAKRIKIYSPKPTRLSRKHPVQMADRIHSDAWRVIFAHCDPRFLLDARLVCRTFKEILDDASLWRISRENYFGEDMPACPTGVTEQQYTNLLVGKGCQNPLCDRRETRKVYWSFMLRACDNCFARYSLSEPKRDANDSLNAAYTACWADTDLLLRPHYCRSLIDLVPCAISAGGKYQHARNMDEDDNWTAQSGHWICLKTDYQVVSDEFTSLQGEEDSNAKIQAWAAECWQKTQQRMISIHKIEEWESVLKDQRALIRNDKVYFYENMALQLSPPMESAVLHKMAAFNNALDTCNRASERSWKLLLPKILPYRAQAERLVRHHRFYTEGYEPPDMSVYRRIEMHRETRRNFPKFIHPEQKVIIDLARRELDHLSNPAANVADEDLLLLCLYNVRNTYEGMDEKPQGLNFDGEVGEYVLSLDDARMIVEEVFYPKINQSTLRGREVYEKFKCPGCARTDSHKTWTFNSIFDHISESHAQQVGDGHDFHRLIPDYQFPPRLGFLYNWFLTPWFRNLPVLPFHYQVTYATRWYADDPRPYVPRKPQAGKPAFRGRHARAHPEVPCHDFEGNFALAAEAFKQTRLDNSCVTRIALKYSLDLFGRENQGIPSLDRWQNCVDDGPSVNPVLDFRYRCGVCCTDASTSKHLQCVARPVQFSVLRRHWVARHERVGRNWTVELMELPTDVEVLHRMLQEDSKLKDEQDKCMEREQLLAQANSRKKPDRKAAALMERRMTMDVFDRLFPRDELHEDVVVDEH